MSKPSLLKQAEAGLTKRLAELESQIQTAESSAAENQRLLLTSRNELQAQTGALLAERQQKLEAMQTAADARVVQAVAAANNARLQQLAAESATTAAEQQLQALETTIQQQSTEVQRLQGLQSDIQQANARLEAINAAVAAAESRKLAILNDITADNIKRDELLTQIIDAQEKREQAAVALRTLLNDIADTQDKDRRAMATLDFKLLAKRQEYERFDRDMEQVRKDLTNRRQQLDDRDKNLRFREQKVAMNEDRIQQNSSLLNL